MFILLVFNLMLIPAVMLGVGFLWKKYPPKTINNVNGYRTKLSKSSQEAWDFAHADMSAEWIKWGIPTTITTVIAIILFRNKCNEDTFSIVTIIILILQMIPLLVPILIVNNHLKSKFDENGRIRITSEQ